MTAATLSPDRSQLSVAVLLLAAACSQAPGGEATPTYSADVQPIVQAKCGGCHVEGGIAPFALGTYEQLSSVKESVKAAVQSRVMPPWLASKDCNSYLGDRSLSDAEIDTVSRWVDGGAPRGDASKAPTESSQSGLSRVDLHLPMSVPFKPTQAPDQYRCFIVDWPATTTKFVTGFRANPGQASIVHHVIAFLAKPADVAKYQGLDDAEEGVGYTCFGGPGGTNTNRVAWVGAWAPGSEGGDFPAGTGIKIEPGSKIVLQVHYNLSSAPALEDLTSVDLKLDDSVEKEAFIQPWANPQWVTGKTMVIPPGEADVGFRFAFDATQFLGTITNGAFTSGQAFKVWSVGLHMHTRGERARLEIERAGGAGKQCLLDIQRWDFHWQGSYRLAKAEIVRPGDAMAVECHFNNTEAKQPRVNGQPQPPRELNWGEGTGDEMCLGSWYMTQ